MTIAPSLQRLSRRCNSVPLLLFFLNCFQRHIPIELHLYQHDKSLRSILCFGGYAGKILDILPANPSVSCFYVSFKTFSNLSIFLIFLGGGSPFQVSSGVAPMKGLSSTKPVQTVSACIYCSDQDASRSFYKYSIYITVYWPGFFGSMFRSMVKEFLD